MIDLANEQLLSMSAACRWLADRSGRQPARVTLYRWTSVGVRGIVLDSTHVGAAIYTSVEALQRFSAALDGRGGPVVSGKRKREIAAAGVKATKAFGG